jgi:hypothetical protein
MSSENFRYIDLHIFYRYHHLLFQTTFNTELLTQGTHTSQQCSLFFYSPLSLCSAKIRNMKSANISNADNPKPLLQSFQRLRNLCISSVGCDAAAAYHGSETLIKAEQRSYCVGMTRYSKCVGLSESGNN